MADENFSTKKVVGARPYFYGRGWSPTSKIDIPQNCPSLAMGLICFPCRRFALCKAVLQGRAALTGMTKDGFS
jgi:hypothetical protein